MVVLIAGMAGCVGGGGGGDYYYLTIASTEGGSVTTPGEETYPYAALMRRSNLSLSLTTTTTLSTGLAM
jgi:hypothetical protein